MKNYCKPRPRPQFALLAFAAAATTASAQLYLGGEFGGTIGDDLGGGATSVLVVGYELPTAKNTHVGFEGNLGGTSVEDDLDLWEDEDDDRINLGFITAGVRITHFISEPDRGLYLFVGGGLGFGSAELDRDGPDLEDDSMFITQVFAGLGYGITENWRVYGQYRWVHSGSAEDHGVEFIGDGDYHTIGAGFIYRF